MIILIFGLIWAALGILIFGSTMAEFSRQFKYKKNGKSWSPCWDKQERWSETETFRHHYNISMCMAWGGILAVPACFSNYFQDGFAFSPDGVKRVCK